MATVTPTVENIVSMGDGTVKRITWALTTANTDGAPAQLPEFNLNTWQGSGTWGGATMAFEGSNDGTTWFPLTKVGTTTAATLTANGGVTTNEAPLYVRPNLTTVGVGATVSAVLVAIRRTPART